MKTIPAVDLSKFVKGTAAEKEQFIKELTDAWKDIGFVTVYNHGVPQDLIDTFFEQVQKFFAFDTNTKLKYEDFDNGGQRGYTSFGREHAKGFDTPDLKEFWQIGQEVTDGDDIVKEYVDNIYVDVLPEFNNIGRELYQSFEVAGAHLLRAVAIYMGIGEDYFEAKIHNGNSILRAIHYPPISKEPNSAMRAEQHEDINLITLLVGASAEGLQAQDVHGNWVPIMPPAGHLVINVGDMLQRLTNNVLRSTPHRVVNPPKEKWGTRRFSIPFFLHPRSTMDLTCLDFCVTKENPIAYEPITAGEYLMQRLREIGLK